MIHRALLVGVVCLLALNAAAFLAGAWVLTRFPFELDYGEGIVLWQVDRVLRLGEAYHPLQRYPYIVFHYPPLYHLLVRLSQTVFDDPLVAGRVVAWISALGVSACTGLIVGLGTVGGRRVRFLAALIASLLVFHIPNITWVPNMRVDMTALWLSLLGFFVCLRWPGARGCAVAAVVFVAALFTKQTMIAAPTATVGALLLAKRTREAATMVVVMAAIGGGLVSLLAAATGGEFLRHTLRYNANPFDLGQLSRFMFANLLGMNALTALALALPLTLIATRRGVVELGCVGSTRGRAVLLTATLYFVAAFGISFSAGKLGAWRYYFLEWNVSCCILTGLLIGRVLRHDRTWSRSPTATAIILIVGVVAFSRLGMTVRQSEIIAGRNVEINQIAADARRALDAMRATGGPVFSDDMTLLMKAGKEVPWEPNIATLLAAVGVWDERPALEMIRTGKFELIVVRLLDRPLFHSPAIRAAIEEAYADAGGPAGRYRILRPRQATGGSRD